MGGKKEFCCLGKMNMYEMCMDCYNAYFSDPDFEAAMHEAYWNEKDIYANTENKCECGSEASGGTTHSHWCPKWQS